MIKIVAKQTIRRDSLDRYYELVKELAEKSRAEEGNVFYTSNQSRSDERVHAFIECWKDDEAIKLHNATEHFTRIVPQLAELFDEPEVVEIYEEKL